MKFSSKGFLPAAAAVLLCFGHASPSLAATATVLVGSGGDLFVPAVTNINVNDRVIWSWVGIGHSTTSGTNGVAGDDNGVPGGLWDSGVNSTGHAFTNTFTSAGNFSYYCSIHFIFGMTGAVVVAAASLPPAVTITNPASGAVFAAPANITIQATNSGAITNVQFLVGSTILTNETIAPFSAVTNNLSAGSYALSAIASDNLGAKATNVVNISVVTPVQVNLDTSQQLSPTSFQFNYSANVGLRYVVQQSANLAAPGWISIFTNTAASNPVVFVDNHATNSPGFYRVGRLPNP